MRIILALVGCLSPLYFANAQGAENCAKRATGHSLEISAPLNKLAQRLVPHLDRIGLENFYLALKREEAAFLAGVDMPEDLIRRLHVERPQFRLATMRPGEIRQFYLNELRALYARAAGEWKRREARRFLSSDAELETAALILDRMVPTYSLESVSFTPSSAAEFFGERKWEGLPWADYENVLREWRAENAGKFSRATFSSFWNARVTGLRVSDYELLASALTGGLRVATCCLSEPGCPDCPNNRRWRVGVSTD